MRKNPPNKKTRKSAYQRHMSKIAKKGGEALVKKYGKKHMKKLVGLRWSKHREDNE